MVVGMVAGEEVVGKAVMGEAVVGEEVVTDAEKAEQDVHLDAKVWMEGMEAMSR